MLTRTTDDDRAAMAEEVLYDVACRLSRADDLALRHLARELEPILGGVEDWISDGRYCKKEDSDVYTDE